MEAHEIGGPGTDLHDFARTVLLAVVLHDAVFQLVEAFVAGLVGDAEFAFRHFFGAGDERGAVAAEAVGFGAAQGGQRQLPDAEDGVRRRRRRRRSRCKRCAGKEGNSEQGRETGRYTHGRPFTANEQGWPRRRTGLPRRGADHAVPDLP